MASLHPEIKQKDNKFQLSSTGLRLHNAEWVSENEAKRVLIYKKWNEFVQDVVKIDIDFPNHYIINGRRKHDVYVPDFNTVFLDMLRSKNSDELLGQMFNKTIKKLNIKLFER